VIEEEIFVSEKLEYAPNPVRAVLNLYVGGKESKIRLTFYDILGRFIEDKEVDVPTSRVYSMNMNRYSEGVYLLKVTSTTINKTIKIVKR